ncbi:hypothetical protein DQT32_04260 [Salmonella enterica subsp. enterica serovar Braenderup]|nr:hypothetical protein [Salmonella enterica subsp. enterica serovar Braenderup]
MTWDKAMSYSFEVAYPSFVWLIITAFVFVLWVFGTDMYDAINDSDSDEDAVLKFFAGMSVVCIFNAIIGFVFTWVNPLNWILNAFVLLCIIMFIGALLIDGCQYLREYCQRKRGKIK